MPACVLIFGSHGAFKFQYQHFSDETRVLYNIVLLMWLFDECDDLLNAICQVHTLSCMLIFKDFKHMLMTNTYRL